MFGGSEVLQNKCRGEQPWGEAQIDTYPPTFPPKMVVFVKKSGSLDNTEYFDRQSGISL